jgi:spore maturation protein SpmA
MSPLAAAATAAAVASLHLQLLKPLFPNFVPDLTALNNVVNTLITDVEARILSLGTAVVQQFKPVLDLK